MGHEEVVYEIDGAVSLVTLNRPQYRNVQSWRLLDELDAALDRAVADDAVRVVVVSGAGGNFSSGHDLGTPEQRADQEARGIPDQGGRFYENFRKYNLEYTLKWRNLSKPTIAMVEGYCIYGGWMIAAAMDLVFDAGLTSQSVRGRQAFEWTGRTNNGELAESGVYILVVNLNDRVVTGKVALIRE